MDLVTGTEELYDMAAGRLNKPGSDYGPCAMECEHTDCAAARAMAAKPCRLCGQPIGYERRFFDTQQDGTVHEACLLTEIAAKQDFLDGFAEVTGGVTTR